MSTARSSATTTRSSRTPRNPDSWFLGGDDGAGDDEDEDEDDELALACRFGGHTFALDGAQSITDIAVDILFQVQDDVIDEMQGSVARLSRPPRWRQPS